MLSSGKPLGGFKVQNHCCPGKVWNGKFFDGSAWFYYHPFLRTETTPLYFMRMKKVSTGLAENDFGRRLTFLDFLKMSIVKCNSSDVFSP